jgi:hypothetical protein
VYVCVYVAHAHVSWSLVAHTNMLFFIIAADDWDFEEAMADLGCTVHAYDPTVTRPENVKNPNIHFHPVGIHSENGQNFEGYMFQTLDTLIKANGDENRTITYLKMDVEGAELTSLGQILKSDVLENIQQIGIEMHTGAMTINTSSIRKVLTAVINAFKVMHDQLGFRLVAYNPNGCVGTALDPDRLYDNYHDLLFYKTS